MDWISVEDRLPESGKDVLAVFVHTGTSDKHIFILHIAIPQEGDTWIQSWGNDDISLDPWKGKVTHWMPLPDLPGDTDA